MNILQLRRKVNDLSAEYRLLGQQLEKEKGVLVALKQEALDLDKARILIQKAALKTQETLRIRLTAICTTALRVVFPDKDLGFNIEFDTKRGRTEAVLEVSQDGVCSDPVECHGGGVVDILSFALRCAFWSIADTRPVMILDEPFKFLSRDLVQNAAEMVKTISEKLGLQVVIVSHIQELIDGADRVFIVEQNEGISVVKEMR